VYPGFGVEAVRRARRQSRGLAMGAYTAFLDLTLGIASPMLGLIAAVAGIGSVFLTSAVVVLGAAVVAIPLLAPISPARHAALLAGNLQTAAGSNTIPRHVDRGNCSALSALLDTTPRCHRENHHGTQT
jgi:hypothetical protein